MTTPDPLKTKNVGSHPAGIMVIENWWGRLASAAYDKVSDLRYGTNPSQTAALYGVDSFLGTLRELRTGKQGPSQTNMEDIFYAALTVGYFDEQAAIIMKHENPSGFAAAYEREPLAHTYKKARDADFRAAFGGTVLVNRPVDMEAVDAMTEMFVEVVVAPDYDEGVLGRFKGSTRVFRYDDEKFVGIPRFTGDAAEPELKRLPDGSLIRSDALLTPLGTVDDLKQYVVSDTQPLERELRDLLTGSRLRLKSNSIRMVKNGYTTGLGVGQQDRIMCIDVAAYKNRRLEELAAREGRTRAADYSLAGSVLVSDGFFPFTDSIELARDLGVSAVLAPHGGERFNEVLAKANEYDIVFVDLPAELRFFSHHG